MSDPSNAMSSLVESDVNDLKQNPPPWLINIEKPIKPKYKCPETHPSPTDAKPVLENTNGDEMRVRATVRPLLRDATDFKIPPIKVELDVNINSYPSETSLPRLWIRSSLSAIESTGGGIHPKFYDAIRNSSHKGNNPIETVLWHFVHRYLRRNADFEKVKRLRFQVGDEVLANVGNWEHGTVVAIWDEGFPYRIHLHDIGQDVHAPCDMDDVIKAPPKMPSNLNNSLDDDDSWPEEAKISQASWMEDMRNWKNAYEFSKNSPEKELFDKTFQNNKWINPKVNKWLCDGCCNTPDFVEEISPNIFSFQLFTTDFCNAIISEYERCETLASQTKQLRIVRPNSMNNYGAIMKNIGFQSLIDIMQDEILAPIAAALFPIVGAELTEQHCFLVRYAPGEDLGLDMHVDESDITFNVCLGKEFTGAGLQFCGMLGSPDHRHQSLRYKHSVGQCVVHLGAQRHGADDIVTGERINLISWNRNKVWRRSSGYMGPMYQLDYKREAGPPDLVCLSKTHDVDWETYCGPREGGRSFPWCPPDFARHVSDDMPTKEEIVK